MPLLALILLAAPDAGVACAAFASTVAIARDEALPEPKRLDAYLALVAEERRLGCPDAAAHAKELERWVRELIAIPFITDLRDGETHLEMRVSFSRVRDALALLSPPDRPALERELSDRARDAARRTCAQRRDLDACLSAAFDRLTH